VGTLSGSPKGEGGEAPHGELSLAQQVRIGGRRLYALDALPGLSLRRWDTLIGVCPDLWVVKILSVCKKPLKNQGLV
jgi:hypothetical protein